MMNRRSSLRCLVGALGALVLLSSNAYADALLPTMRIWLQDLNTGKGLVITDNGVGDAAVDDFGDPILGLIAYSGTVGGFGISFSTGVSQPITGGTYNESQLVLNSTNIRTTTGIGRLRIVLEDINYGPSAGSRTLSGNVSGILTGAATDNVTFNAWASPTNQVPSFGADDPPPSSLLGPLGALPADAVTVWPGGITFGLPSGSTTTSFAGDSGTLLVANGGYYSLFSELVLNLTGPASLSLSNLSVAVTPEPTTMLLFGTGVSAVAWAKRRRRNKAGQRPSAAC